MRATYTLLYLAETLVFAADKQRRFLAVVVLAITAGSAASFVWWRSQPEPSPPTCQTRGAIDTLKAVDSSRDSIRIEGWAADVSGVQRIEIWAGGALLVGVKPNTLRTDVAATFPQCKFPAVSGFAETLARVGSF